MSHCVLDDMPCLNPITIIEVESITSIVCTVTTVCSPNLGGPVQPSIRRIGLLPLRGNCPTTCYYKLIFCDESFIDSSTSTHHPPSKRSNSAIYRWWAMIVATTM
ncbi:uncharacterized protein YALI1_B11588g [Yarrowia lipolytica]|uniref:Uncharacterized protein n=1 Tax=Yarrowia lipolytica TaxID=4952 RepID=A0A1D8N713_YARLL|nr:hypothetical protein YALI1_B11588g [Yarrowia lipolytica]